MYNAENDGHFHLERVGEHESVERPVPARVQAEWIPITVIYGCDEGSVIIRESPARMPEMERFGENVIVHEAGIHREHAHQQNNVSATVDRSMSRARRKSD